MQASVNERELVLDMLLQITRDGEYSHIVIKNVLDKYQYLDKRERAFITALVPDIRFPIVRPFSISVFFNSSP